jgi:creatinine amidohydrolase
MSAPPRRRWAELTSADFAEPEAGSWVAVLPVAATEQHGPHLPTGVDTMIGDGLLDAAIAAMPDALPAIVLPTLAVGKSDEHRNFPGTLSLSAETLLRTLVEIGESVARAGLAKLVIMSSHGGNSEVMGLAARELRLRRNMLVVATSWARLGQPDGLFRDDERRHGIHAGDIETSLMLHLAPGLVHMEEPETEGDTMKRLALTAVAATFAIGIGGAAAQQQFVTIGTGGVTGVYYPAGGAICRLVNQGRAEHGIRCSAESTGGSVFNVNTIREGELDFGVVQSDVQYNALNGIEQFDADGAFEELRAVFSLHPEPFTVLVRADSGINPSRT